MMGDRLVDEIWEKDGRFFAEHSDLDVLVRPYVQGEISQRIGRTTPQSAEYWRDQRVRPEQWATMVVRWAGLTDGKSGLERVQAASAAGALPQSLCFFVRDRSDAQPGMVTSLRIPMRRSDLGAGITELIRLLGGFHGEGPGVVAPDLPIFIEESLRKHVASRT